MKKDRKETRDSAGFTLLEVIVAMGIIGAAMPFLVMSLVSTSRMRAESEDLITASHLLRDKMSELESIESLPSGQSQGEFLEGARFQWQINVGPTNYNSLYDVSVVVSWVTGGRMKQLGARTYILGEAQEAEESSAQPAGQGGR